MNTKEFKALKIGDVIRYTNERAEFVVTEKLSNGMYKAQCTRLIVTARLWEMSKRNRT